MSAHTAVHESTVGHEWRGRAGMIGLIIAESSLFGVFVVAHLFYTGKSGERAVSERRAQRSP